jgi:hypothetical protein
VPLRPETNGARGVDKPSLRLPGTLNAAVSLAFIDAVLEFKYVKCLLVRTIFALVSIAKRLSH